MSRQITVSFSLALATATIFMLEPTLKPTPSARVHSAGADQPGLQMFRTPNGVVMAAVQQHDWALEYACPTAAVEVAAMLLHRNKEELSETREELERWRSGELRFVPEIVNVDEGSVSAGTVSAAAAERETPRVGSKRSLEQAGSSEASHEASGMATLVRVKKERADLEADLDEHEGTSALFINFPHTVLDGVDHWDLTALCACVQNCSAFDAAQRKAAIDGKGSFRTVRNSVEHKNVCVSSDDVYYSLLDQLGKSLVLLGVPEATIKAELDPYRDGMGRRMPARSTLAEALQFEIAIL